MLDRKRVPGAEAKFSKSTPNGPGTQTSIWVVLGFFLWIGFFLGAVILHAMIK